MTFIEFSEETIVQVSAILELTRENNTVTIITAQSRYDNEYADDEEAVAVMFYIREQILTAAYAVSERGT